MTDQQASREDGGSGKRPQKNRILFLFLDGVGLALAGPHNPFSTVPMPHFRDLLGGPLVLGHQASNGAVLRGVDASLGVPGLPQSATGQTALFTGVNAAALLGEHLTAHPNAALREVIAEHSLLKRAAEFGARVLFANAHSEQFWRMVRDGRRGLGASTLTALAAGAPIPTMSDLAAGRAVLWDITHEVASTYLGFTLPQVSAAEAGWWLACLAAEYDLVLFETFLPDLAGHRRVEPEWVLSRLDDFLGGILAHRTVEMTLVICSDHGNLEDTSTRLHTANPVPLLAVGPAAECFRRVDSIMGVTPAILESLRG